MLYSLESWLFATVYDLLIEICANQLVKSKQSDMPDLIVIAKFELMLSIFTKQLVYF